MKKYLFIISFMILGMNTHPQDYHKLIRTGTYWDNYFVVLPEMCYTSISRYCFTGGDTVLGGVTYKQHKCYPFEAVNPGPLCPPFVIDTTPVACESFFREDTVARKVYIYCPGCITEDQLFYDFSLAIGDTLKSDMQTLYGEPLVLTSIDTVTLLNGEKRKRFGFVHSADNVNYIESIGGSQGLEVPLVSGAESYGGYLCVKQDGIPLWGNNCGFYFIGTGNKENDLFKVYPNPVHDFLSLHLPRANSDAVFTLSDPTGKVIARSGLDQSDNLISVSQIAPGLYIYQVRSDQIDKQGKIIIF